MVVFAPFFMAPGIAVTSIGASVGLVWLIVLGVALLVAPLAALQLRDR